ncbi:asparaginase [Acidaminobacter sp. JC074]|uniref:asparaginase n=1 Tax=Acidaminobacter sp. JC074 TaxID=2530199 RepID=UPI001F1162AE|nr:asparaginase [Acidaminobacter sp. JC074]MCH4885992.1 asparaginase [Acidaminobacter sp. JC074]
MSVELVHVYRNNLVESIHRFDVVAVKNSEIIFSYGDPYKETFWRSSAKPFQVIPFLESGGRKAYDIYGEELALMTSSHGGEEEHVKTVKSIFKKMKVSTDLLDCGTSAPMYSGEFKRMIKENLPFTPLNNPCSGKHSAMIGYGLLNNIDLDNYIDKDHPIQKKMLSVVADYTDMDKDKIHIAIDGCGVPVFGLPIYNMALAYEKLSSDKPFMKEISKAMTTHPYYVAGTGRLDTIIMEETKCRILAKLGAESVYCMTDLKNKLAIAIKTEDGAYRALDALVPDLLFHHDLIDEIELKAIKARLPLQIKNHRKEIVGTYKTLL